VKVQLPSQRNLKKESNTMENKTENIVRIKIVGVGGGCNNAIERMRKTEIPMVSYVSINTDNGAHTASTADYFEKCFFNCG
jgi:cell division GTPase FtsZ